MYHFTFDSVKRHYVLIACAVISFVSKKNGVIIPCAVISFRVPFHFWFRKASLRFDFVCRVICLENQILNRSVRRHFICLKENQIIILCTVISFVWQIHTSFVCWQSNRHVNAILLFASTRKTVNCHYGCLPWFIRVGCDHYSVLMPWQTNITV